MKYLIISSFLVMGALFLLHYRDKTQKKKYLPLTNTTLTSKQCLYVISKLNELGYVELGRKAELEELSNEDIQKINNILLTSGYYLFGIFKIS